MLINFVPRITVERPRKVPNIIEWFSFGTPEINFGSVGNIWAVVGEGRALSLLVNKKYMCK